MRLVISPRECPKKKKTNNASSSGGSDVHCLTYTDDQSQWIMMLAEFSQIREQSNNIEFLVDSGGTVLTATGAPVES